MHTLSNLTKPEQVAYFINEREAIRAGKQTKDNILGQYRFCNVRREDDRVTRWLAKYWRPRYAADKNYTAIMLIARMFNWPPTLKELMQGPVEDIADPAAQLELVEIVHGLQASGVKAYSSAYVVTTCGKAMDKAVYVVQTVCGAVAVGRVAPRKGDTLQAFWTRLRSIDGLGAGFLAAQVAADLKNTSGNPLAAAPDWETWAVPGPGSRRGVNRYYDERLRTVLPDNIWHKSLAQIKQEVEPYLPQDLQDTHMQDWQNVMCEMDKYWRTYYGEGKPRQRYAPETSYSV